jgi:hypothetical protein
VYLLLATVEIRGRAGSRQAAPGPPSGAGSCRAALGLAGRAAFAGRRRGPCWQRCAMLARRRLVWRVAAGSRGGAKGRQAAPGPGGRAGFTERRLVRGARRELQRGAGGAAPGSPTGAGSFRAALGLAGRGAAPGSRGGTGGRQAAPGLAGHAGFAQRRRVRWAAAGLAGCAAFAGRRRGAAAGSARPRGPRRPYWAAPGVAGRRRVRRARRPYWAAPPDELTASKLTMSR